MSYQDKHGYAMISYIGASFPQIIYNICAYVVSVCIVKMIAVRKKTKNTSRRF